MADNGAQTLDQVSIDARSEQRDFFAEYVQLVQTILETSAEGTSWNLDAIVPELVRLAMLATGAEVGYVRRAVGNDWLEMFTTADPVQWSMPPAERWGAVPYRTHVRDCFNGEDPSTFTLSAHGHTFCFVRDNSKDPAEQYKPEETQYLQGLGSIACARLGAPKVGPPRFLLILGHRNQGVLSTDSQAHNTLRKLQPLLDAAFRLAEVTQDRIDKSRQLKGLAEALPLLALAPSKDAFWRGVGTILTAQTGFRFDRAMIFLWRGESEIGECAMALGGMSSDWANRRQEVALAFGSNNTLRDYMEDALNFPEPGTGTCKLEDPLYTSLIKTQPLVFRAVEASKIARWLESIEGQQSAALEAQPAERLTSSNDSWILKIANDRPGVFFRDTHNNWPKDEYFAFPLVAMDGSNLKKIGFVIADVAYAPGGHVSGMYMPDLEITATVLHLIAGMWVARQTAQAYMNSLAAIRALRHEGGKVPLLFDSLISSLPDPVKEQPPTKSKIEEMQKSCGELGRAKRIVEGLEDQRLNTGQPTDPLATVSEAGKAAQTAHPDLLFSIAQDPGPVPELAHSPWKGEFVRIPPESLREILDCILDNAAEFAKIGQDGQLRAKVHASLRLLDAVGGTKSATPRLILITLENDGPPIKPSLAPFLFTDGVTTRSAAGHGTGLSTARQIAKAYRGDVILLSNCERVTFGIVLPIAETVS